LITSRQKLHELEERAQRQRENIAKIEERLSAIRHLLAVRKQDLSLQDIIAAEGRNEAGKLIRGRLAETDTAIGEKIRLESVETERMRSVMNPRRTQEIRDFYVDRLVTFASRLSVRIDELKNVKLASMPFGRGSEGPRGIITYYYAFLHTVRRYSTSAFCPIVIDAPNQQGQDDMPHVMHFILDEQPAGSQVIIATEHLFGLTKKDATILNVGKRKNQLLDEDRYDEVSDILRPYLGQLI
jgi:hypothetical protein